MDSDTKIDTNPWIEKYRPQTLNKIIAHNEILETLKKFIAKKCLPHLLFYGPAGTGKTSTITACAKELYGDKYKFMVMELNASDDRGIEVVRTKIKEFVCAENIFPETKNLFKLVILDETDAMTEDAQAILRNVVEKYTKTTRFCLICNYIKDINPALQSRCTQFRFSPIKKDDIKKKIIEIKKLENIKITISGLDTLIDRSGGDMRKVLNILQSVSMAYDKVNENNINNFLGYPRKIHIDIIIKSLLNDDFKTCFDNINSLKKEQGLSINDIIYELHNLMLLQIINKNTYEIDEITIISILSKLAEIEYNQSVYTDENNNQLSSLIGVFKSQI